MCSTTSSSPPTPTRCDPTPELPVALQHRGPAQPSPDSDAFRIFPSHSQVSHYRQYPKGTEYVYSVRCLENCAQGAACCSCPHRTRRRVGASNFPGAGGGFSVLKESCAAARRRSFPARRLTRCFAAPALWRETIEQHRLPTLASAWARLCYVLSTLSAWRTSPPSPVADTPPRPDAAAAHPPLRRPSHPPLSSIHPLSFSILSRAAASLTRSASSGSSISSSATSAARW